MNAADIKIQLRQARQEMQRVLAEQAAQRPLPPPNYVPPIGAYAEDDPALHRTLATQERERAESLR